MTIQPDRDDLMARVRRADPAATQGELEPRPVEALLARLDADATATAADGPRCTSDTPATAPRRVRHITSADRGTRRSRPRRVVAGFVAAALTGAALLAAVALPIGDRAHLDVVAEARAQLSLSGGILHTVTLQMTDPPIPETYALSDGVRHTIDHTTIRAERWAEPSTGAFHQRTTVVEIGPETEGEQSYSGGRFMGSRNGKIESMKVNREQASVLWRIGLLSGFPSISTTQPDPIVALRGMLADGTVRASGEQVSGGRKVIRLVPVAAGRPPKDSIGWEHPSEYLVDAATFAPVQVTFRFDDVLHTPSGTELHPVPVTTTIHFVTFERLPATPSTRRLLSIDPAGRKVFENPNLFGSPKVLRKLRKAAASASP